MELTDILLIIVGVIALTSLIVTLTIALKSKKTSGNEPTSLPLDPERATKNDIRMLSESFVIQMDSIKRAYNDYIQKDMQNDSKFLQEISSQIGEVKKSTESFNNLSQQVIDLQRILNSNTSRGAFGEYQLSQILYATFGDNSSLYKTQCVYKENGEELRPDAVVFMCGVDIIIDSKFPYGDYSKLFDGSLTKDEELIELKKLENAIKEQIKQVEKYKAIKTASPYLIMFIPLDGLLNIIHYKQPNLIDLARKKNIIICSPSTLVPLLCSYKVLNIEFYRSKYAKTLGEQIVKLEDNFRRFNTRWAVIRDSINKCYGEIHDYEVSVNKIQNELNSIVSEYNSALESGDVNDETN